MNYQMKKKLNITPKNSNSIAAVYQQQINCENYCRKSDLPSNRMYMQYVHTVCVSCCLYISLNHLSNVNPMFLTVVASINVQTTVFKTACWDQKRVKHFQSTYCVRRANMCVRCVEIPRACLKIGLLPSL